MVRRGRIRRFVFGIAVLIVSHALLEWRAPASGQSVSKKAKAALKERDRLGDQARKLRAAGKIAEAIAAAEAKLAIEQKLLHAGHDDIVDSLSFLAELQVERENFAAAKKSHLAALEILRKLNGKTHWKVTDARLALESVERRAGLRRDQRQKLDDASRLNSEAVALAAAGKDGEALRSVRRAVSLYQEVLGERHPTYANSLNNLAVLLRTRGDYAAAKPLFVQALAIRKEVLGERHAAYASSLNDLALLLKSQGRYANARPLYEQALAIRKEVLGEHHPDYATSLCNLAVLLQAQGDYAAARPLLEKALAINKEVLGERHPFFANSLNNLAELLHAQGDYAAARPLYEKALAIYKDGVGESNPLFATSLNNLAELLQAQREYAAARPLLERALAINKEVLGERHPLFATSLNNLAELLQAQGEYAAARPLYEKAMAIYKDGVGERHPLFAISLNNLAELLQAQGDYTAARPLYEKSRAINKDVLGERHPLYATNLFNLGVLLWAQRDYAGAAPLLKQALEIVQGNLDLAAAAQSERQQLVMAQNLRMYLDCYLSLAPMANRSAEDAYGHVLASKGVILDRQRRLRILRRRFQADPRSELAQHFTDYEQAVKQLATLALATPDPNQVQAWREALADLARRKDELEAVLAQLDAGFRADQAAASRTPIQFQAALPPGTALVDLLVYTAVQLSAQGKGEFQAERRLVAFVVRPDRPIARVDLGPIGPIIKAIDEWRPILVGGKIVPAAVDPARMIRRRIWEPVEPHLDGITSVLVSSDGALGQIPLAALPGKEPNSYLIEEQSISVVPVPRMLGSAAIIAVKGRAGAGPKPEPVPSLLLAGDIDYGGDPGKGDVVTMGRSAAIGTRAGFLGDFRHLPATGDEIASIGRYFRNRFRGAEAVELDGERATEEAFRRAASGHRYLHLATHGYFAPPELRSALGPGDPKASRSWIDALGSTGVAGYHPGLLSGIALAGANRRPTPIGQDDGILTALEVAELDLSGVELAVLSACETGLGEVAGGEGLLGLQRAFQIAGARSVVASLWNVGDEPTRALMARFYENLWRKGLPPAEALREAQLSMLRGGLLRGTLKRETDGPKSDRLLPFYWAAFVLSTD